MRAQPKWFLLTGTILLTTVLILLMGVVLGDQQRAVKPVPVTGRQKNTPADDPSILSEQQPVEKNASSTPRNAAAAGSDRQPAARTPLPTQRAALSGHRFPLATCDTLLWFGAEDSMGNGSRNDRITGTPWTTEDRTASRLMDMWHPDTFRAISGEYSLWWGDPQISGYASELYEALLSPRLFIPTDKDSLFLIYKHHIRCEEAHGFGIIEGWDGYNVRIQVAGSGAYYDEIAPYQMAFDSSFYRTPPDSSNEWNILRCWEKHGEQEGPYGEPYDPWIGGFACDGTGPGGDETVAIKIFDLRSFAGDTIQVAFVGGSDWGYDTSDDSTLFGFIIDDVLIVEGLDSARLADLPIALGGDTLFYDGFEGTDPGWERYLGHVPTGDWWWLAHGDALTEPCKLMCSDSITTEFAQNLHNYIISPKIAHDDLPDDMASLDLIWYFKGDPEGQDLCGYNEYKLDDGTWKSISVLNHICGYIYNMEGIDNDTWWCVDQWSTWMHDMSPLVTDSTIFWDTLQVAIGVSNGIMDTTGTVGLQVDHITLSGRIGAPYDIGVTAVKIPGPNANHIEVVIDSVAITNHGFNVASSGVYQVFMAVLDSTRTPVFGPAQVLDYLHAPNIEPLETVMAKLDPTKCTFTLTEEGSYDFKVWTAWALDTTAINDTLKLPYTAKADHYPGFYNHPAGQGELRCHDQGFYTYPQIVHRSMGAGDIAAVHFTPAERFWPFDLRYVRPGTADSAVICTLKVWGSGSMPDEAPLLAVVTFDPSAGQVINLDPYQIFKDLCSDFWIGVQFPARCEAIMGMEMAENEPGEYPGRCWGRSYLKTDTTGWEWPPLEYDWLITAGICWRTVAPEIYKLNDDIHIIWEYVSQASQYYIYRQTDPNAAIAAPFDSTPTASYTDTGAVGDTTTNYYYWLHSIHQDRQIYDKLSQGVGEFDRFLPNVP